MTNQQATMYFDVTCPFAWVTSRWLKEVEKVRDVDVTFIPMSLSVLNDGRDLEESYMRAMGAAWAPALVAAAIYTDYPDKIDAYYTSMGERIHDGGNGHKQDPHGYDEIIAEALAEVGLPAELIEVAHKREGDDGSVESTLRTLHEQAITKVGNDVGTPVVQLGDVAFFGPVLTRIPKGEKAGTMFDAAVELASYEHFFELKRSRTEDPRAEFA
ncbi:disulfide bond formation protein DsbA [Corynebacterium sp. 320]|uniref:Disulfide bond formation protein DsbA n=1 Tax=Corynebacterium zhongnanshanii TaxID=2768834 RepID=A0ABQ6VDH0_9CORY|nr:MULTISPECIES: disulfide bond formation protein DsbA [Corynebacterium]KAB1501457.1 disulfide bond formation protein DsbA [Corynebacterium sp. 320]KAB1551754.1 disulfide bond formation protein DsbA [Corynebacterium sp. 319]KAB3520958.1 disulfide bond formation protein DsbA [Corynebacterium zhongnanshanii]KAB3525815.1 disulfide bond formation protein DsbA [Corynebacterium sp. 250]KAB3538749.1 disulfide bond formation protein DsbA [Corynebacterium sp. 366]